MKKRLNKLVSAIKRVFSNETLSYRIYMVWGAITLLLFGFFGMYPVSKSLVNNINLAGDMYKTNSDLSKKIQDLKKMKQDLDAVGDAVNLLETNLPDYYDSQNHMVELSLLVSNSGFYFDKFNPNSGSQSVANSRGATVSITGVGDLYKLIKDIESSTRLSEVTDVRVSNSNEGLNVNMTIRSYIME